MSACHCKEMSRLQHKIIRNTAEEELMSVFTEQTNKLNKEVNVYVTFPVLCIITVTLLM